MADSDGESEEEEIVLKNSPLYKYLNDLEVQEKFSDPEICPTSELEADINIENDSSFKNVAPQFSSEVLSEEKYIATSPDLQKQKQWWQSRQLLLESNLLADEDVDEMIIADEIGSDGVRKHNDYKFYQISFVVLFLSVAAVQFTIPQFLTIFLTVTVFLSILYTLYCGVRYKNSTEQLICNFKKFDDVIFQCLKLIREREVLKRGYSSLCSKTATSAIPLLLPDNSSNKWCLLHLRHKLLDNMKSIISVLQNQCNHITNGSNNGLRLAVSLIDWNELEKLILESMPALTKLDREHVFMQLDTLKAVHDFYCMQRSEFLRVLCTIAYSESIQSIVISELDSSICELETELISHSAWNVIKDVRHNNKDIDLENKQSQCNIESTAAKSLCLHLQTAMETSLPLICEPPVHLSQLDLETIETALKCSMTCLIEVRDNLYPPVLKNTPIQHSPNEKLDSIDECSMANEHTNLNAVPPKIIGDQMFEIVVEKEENGSEEHASDHFEGTVIEKRSVDGMMGELKCVLKGRSEVMRHREAVALAAFKGVKVEQVQADFEKEEQEREERISAANVQKSKPRVIENSVEISTSRKSVPMALKNELQAMFQHHFNINTNSETTIGDSSDSDSKS